MWRDYHDCHYYVGLNDSYEKLHLCNRVRAWGFERPWFGILVGWLIGRVNEGGRADIEE